MSARVSSFTVRTQMRFPETDDAAVAECAEAEPEVPKSEAVPEQTCFKVDDISPDVLKEVFSRLDTPESLAKVSMACKPFYKAANDNDVWKKVVGKVINIEHFSPKTDFKKVYIDYKNLWPVKSSIYVYDVFSMLRPELVEQGLVIDRRLPYAGEPEFELSRMLLQDLHQFAEKRQFPIINHVGKIQRFFVQNKFQLASMDATNYSPEILWVAEAIAQAPFSFPWLVKEHNDVSPQLKSDAVALINNLKLLMNSLKQTSPAPEFVEAGPKADDSTRLPDDSGKERGGPDSKDFSERQRERWITFDKSWGKFIEKLLSEQRENKREYLAVGNNGEHHFDERSLAGYYKEKSHHAGKAFCQLALAKLKNEFMSPEIQLAMYNHIHGYPVKLPPTPGGTADIPKFFKMKYQVSLSGG